MRRLLLTLPTPAENLALDEALLDWAEAETERGRESFATGNRRELFEQPVAKDSRPRAWAEAEDPQWEFLRVWESPEPIVVAGRSSRLHLEIHESACAARGIPVLRRSSGGAAIVAGPGCLMYALVLSFGLRPELRDIRQAHRFVLGRLAEGLRAREFSVEHAGTSDLVISDCGFRIADWPIRNPKSEIRNSKKFSGNSLRVKRTHLLYHGTLLYDFDLSLISHCLLSPPRQPEYRFARGHDEFVANLPITRGALVEAVLAAWPTTGEMVDWPQSRVAALVAERFSQESWNREFA